MIPFKKVDTKNSDPVEVTDDKKNFLTTGKLIGSVVRDIAPVFFLGFHLDYVSEKFALDIKNILTILYLKELGVFGYRVQLYRRKVNIQNLLNMGIVSRIPTQRKARYKYMLTPYGNEIVDSFIDSIKNNDRFVESSGQTDAQREILSALNNFFN